VTYEESLARAAYQSYGAVTDFKNYQGLPMPEFDALTPKIREAWQAAASRVSQIARSTRPPGPPDPPKSPPGRRVA
jgi:hypothetical protein